MTKDEVATELFRAFNDCRVSALPAYGEVTDAWHRVAAWVLKYVADNFTEKTDLQRLEQEIEKVLDRQLTDHRLVIPAAEEIAEYVLKHYKKKGIET